MSAVNAIKYSQLGNMRGHVRTCQKRQVTTHKIVTYAVKDMSLDPM